jgi:hypothetical protein
LIQQTPDADIGRKVVYRDQSGHVLAVAGKTREMEGRMIRRLVIDDEARAKAGRVLAYAASPDGIRRPSTARRTAG